MLVQEYEIERIQRRTDAIGEHVTHEIRLNKQLLSNNLPYPEYIALGETSLLQIQVCSECATAGCAAGNYAQVLMLEDYVLWKKPSLRLFENHWEREHYTGIQSNGNIVWTRDMYLDFCRELGAEDLSRPSVIPEIDGDEAVEMWLAYIFEGALPDEHKHDMTRYDIRLADYAGEEPLEFISRRLRDSEISRVVGMSPPGHARENARAFNRIWEVKEKEIVRASPEAYYLPIDARIYLRVPR